MKKTSVILAVMLVALVSNVFGADKLKETAEKETITKDVYTLVKVDNSIIPGMVSHGEHDIMLHSGTFIIADDEKCISKTVFGSQKINRDVKGSYTREGSILNVQWLGAGRTHVTIEGDTLTMNNEGMMFIYKKQPAPQTGVPVAKETAVSERDLNGDFQGGTYVNSLGAKMPLMWQGGGGSFHYENDGSNGDCSIFTEFSSILLFVFHCFCSNVTYL